MTVTNLNVAESWESVYDAFESVNFASYDFETVKTSLLDYLKIYYPENYNDYNDNDLMIAVIETFAYAVELIAYRVDMASHENFLPDAQRKKNILSMAKYISYNATRNIPLRGLVKIDSISTTEELFDSRGENLKNKIIKWCDASNPNWKDQFLTVLNKVLTTRFGQPLKTNQIDNTVYQIYTFDNTLQKNYNVFKNGVYQYNVQNGNENLAMELVSSDIDTYGVFEKTPDTMSKFNIVYSNDGLGDSSPGTGFMIFTKQGELKKYSFTFNNPIPNTFIDINTENINNIDVWVQTLDYYDGVINTWESVETITGQNVFFNNIVNRKKYEVETREDDKIRIIFGDGDFSDMPVGNLAVWVRKSENKSIQIQKNKILQVPVQIGYESTTGQVEYFTLTFSLTNSLQNNAESESIERVRFAAPKIFYSQNRLVNGEDYNTFLFRDPSVLKLKSFNRTYVGQSRYISPTDATGKYQSLRIFGDDLNVYYDFNKSSQSKNISSKKIIDEVIEPLLATKEIQTAIQFINSKCPITKGLRITPRTFFFEHRWKKISGGGYTAAAWATVQEKTPIQKMLDTHWYGYFDQLITTDDGVFALVDTDADSKIHDSDYRIAKTINGEILYSDASSGVQPGAREKRFGIKYIPATAFRGSLDIAIKNTPNTDWIIECIEITADDQIWHAKCSNDSAVHVINTKKYIDNDFSVDDLSFKFKSYVEAQPCFIGDSFIVRAHSQRAIKANVQGTFATITNVPDDLSADYFSYEHITENPSVDDNSWLIIVDRVDDAGGNTLYWQVTNRDAKMACESLTTKFWFSEKDAIVDSDTQLALRDSISVLKSNLNSQNTVSIGVNKDFYIQEVEKDNTGNSIFTKVSVLPKYKLQDYFTTENVNIFSDLIDLDNDYVYFTVKDDKYTPIKSSNYVVSKFKDNSQMIYVPNDADKDQTTYARKVGREQLDFMWVHYAPSDNVVDASTTNINDMYVLTKGYYDLVTMYTRDLIQDPPAKPTSVDLKNAYANLLTSKMMSDTVVLQSAEIKLLFGDKSDKQLRSKFKIIRNETGTLSDEMILREVVAAINDYFKIENWNFGDTLYAQHMLSVIQKQFYGEINSIVLVPTYANNYFGNMLIVDCGINEILQSCATIDDIEIVSTYSNSTLRIK